MSLTKKAPRGRSFASGNTLRQLGPEPMGSLNIRVPVTSLTRWSAAARAAGRSRSAWIRATLDAAP